MFNFTNKNKIISELEAALKSCNEKIEEQNRLIKEMREDCELRLLEKNDEIDRKNETIHALESKKELEKKTEVIKKETPVISEDGKSEQIRLLEAKVILLTRVNEILEANKAQNPVKPLPKLMGRDLKTGRFIKLDIQPVPENITDVIYKIVGTEIGNRPDYPEMHSHLFGSNTPTSYTPVNGGNNTNP